jgi:PST family polysaccharide transporter
VTAKIVLPLSVLLAITIYLLRDDVLLLLFSPAFLVSRDHVSTQLFGDILRVASGIVGYIIIVRGSRWTFLLTELVFLSSYLILGYVLIDRFGWIGAIDAFVLCHLVYLAIAPFAARKILWG